MINYYEYETSPRKLEPQYEEKKKKVKRTKKNNKHEKKSINDFGRLIKCIIQIAFVFIIFLTICYRYALINSEFTSKENLKSELLEIQKQNAQLKLNIEKSTNINNIEQQAKEKLGMKQLDNSQKIYVSLPKQDYVESSNIYQKEDKFTTWWETLINDLFGN